MPELPEVEIMCRNLRRWASGRRLLRVERVDPRLPVELDALAGGTVEAVGRRGKLALIHVVGREREVVLLHFRMSGKLVREDQPAAGGRRRKVRLRLVLEGPGPASLVLDDSRCLAQAEVLPAAELPAELERRGLGPEPWPDRHVAAWWQGRFAGAQGAIKSVLLQQHRVAGLGNIAASEVLFDARISPFTPVPRLDAAAWTRLAAAVPDFVDRVLATESGDEIHLVQHGGPNPFRVYGREGEPCRACDAALQRAVQSGRSTFWCPSCQPGEQS
jgi:formamidopyrimidine-DNA glycosylase